jgi:hypothetical protein
MLEAEVGQVKRVLRFVYLIAIKSKCVIDANGSTLSPMEPRD